jgi:hypothetical protein
LSITEKLANNATTPTTTTTLTEYNNLTELISSKSAQTWPFYSLFTKTSVESFKYVDILVDLSAPEAVSSEIQVKLSENYRNFTVESLSGKNFLNFNWLDVYVMRLYAIQFTTRTISTAYIRPIELILNFYDEKIAKLNELSDIMWSRFENLAPNKVDYVEERVLGDLRECIERIRVERFEGSESLMRDYLVKKGASLEMLENMKGIVTKSGKAKRLAELLMGGYTLTYLYAPMDPIDPLENDNLIKKNELDLEEIKSNELEIKRLNRSKLKYFEKDINIGNYNYYNYNFKRQID